MPDDTKTQRSELRFLGSIQDLKVKQPKLTTSSYSYSAQRQGGSMELTFRIERPEPPAKPQKPYELQNGTKPEPLKQAAPKKPAALKKKTGESDDELAARQAQADADYETKVKEHAGKIQTRDQQIKRWEEAEKRWGRVQAIYNQQASEYPARLMAYANLTGIVAALGDIQCEVSIMPAATDLLPGFAPSAIYLDKPTESATELARAEDELHDAVEDAYDDFDDD